VKVRAPFHVGQTFEHGWELFGWQMMHEWFNLRWDYYFTQRLQTQLQRLMLRHECERATKQKNRASRKPRKVRGG
jgi:hypothetical protein